MEISLSTRLCFVQESVSFYENLIFFDLHLLDPFIDWLLQYYFFQSNFCSFKVKLFFGARGEFELNQWYYLIFIKSFEHFWPFRIFQIACLWIKSNVRTYVFTCRTNYNMIPSLIGGSKGHSSSFRQRLVLIGATQNIFVY